MKKIIAVLLCFILAVLFCGCSNKTNKPQPKLNTNDIASDLAAGKITEAEFALGTPVDTVKQKFDEQNEDGLEITQEKNGCSTITIGEYNYVYSEEERADGITAIYTFDTAYGFTVGSSSSFTDVVPAFDKAFNLTETSKSVIPTEDDAFFVPGGLPSGAQMVVYSNEKCTLKCFFISDFLFAVILTK